MNCYEDGNRLDPFKFRTWSGLEYLYDDYSGLIFPVEPEILEKLYAGNKTYLNIERGRSPVPAEITAGNIKSFIENNSFNQLTLEMTAACNFRCKYCVYGEHYPETRMYSSRKMDFITAKKAVDYWTCSTTLLVVSQVLQNALHFAVFKRKLFGN
ncbi:MAG: hypothetical protein LBL79_14740 [Prevotella sp.]|jgi:hypothetical protein|nr:hypothetical protein [Prevotella sp.]